MFKVVNCEIPGHNSLSCHPQYDLPVELDQHSLDTPTK